MTNDELLAYLKARIDELPFDATKDTARAQRRQAYCDALYRLTRRLRTDGALTPAALGELGECGARYAAMAERARAEGKPRELTRANHALAAYEDAATQVKRALAPRA